MALLTCPLAGIPFHALRGTLNQGEGVCIQGWLAEGAGLLLAGHLDPASSLACIPIWLAWLVGIRHCIPAQYHSSIHSELSVPATDIPPAYPLQPLPIYPPPMGHGPPLTTTTYWLVRGPPTLSESRNLLTPCGSWPPACRRLPGHGPSPIPPAGSCMDRNRLHKKKRDLLTPCGSCSSSLSLMYVAHQDHTLCC